MYITAGNFRPGRGADGCRATAVGGAFGRAYFPATPAPQWHLVASTAADALYADIVDTRASPDWASPHLLRLPAPSFATSRHHYPFILLTFLPSRLHLFFYLLLLALLSSTRVVVIC